MCETTEVRAHCCQEGLLRHREVSRVTSLLYRAIFSAHSQTQKSIFSQPAKLLRSERTIRHKNLHAIIGTDGYLMDSIRGSAQNSLSHYFLVFFVLEDFARNIPLLIIYFRKR